MDCICDLLKMPTHFESPPDQPIPDQVSLEEVDLVVSRLAKMRGMSATKRFALGALSSLTGKTQGETIQPLIGVLSDPSLTYWRDREMAAWALGRTSLNPEDRDVAAAVLMDVLESASKENPWRWISRLALRCTAAHFGFLFLVVLVDHQAFGYMPFWGVMFTGAMLTMPFSLPASIWYDGFLADRARIAASVSLGNLSIPETAGALAGALRDRNRAVRVAAAEALHNVLPTIIDADFGKFGSQTITNLAQGLNYPDGRLVFKLLDALEKVGTGLAVPYVEKLQRSGRTTRVQDAASRVLETLKVRQHRENQSDRLLRSAVSPADPSEILLRPPTPGNDTETVRLLRSSIEEMN